MAEVILRCHPSATRVRVRELAGKDEQLVESSSTVDAVRLIGAVISSTGVGRAPDSSPDPMSLSACDRDRILTAIYLATFGSRITSTMHCSRCGNLFDLNFRLDELAAALDGSLPEGVEVLGAGRFRSAAGFEFRVPTASEEIEAARRDPSEAEQWLANQCLLSSSAPPDIASIQQAMEEAAPALDLELTAQCPECNASQLVRFDIQSYLLDAVRQGLPRLTRDVHRVASAYHWSQREILSLPRSQRRDLVDMIEGEVSVRRSIAL